MIKPFKIESARIIGVKSCNIARSNEQGVARVGPD